MAVSTLFGCAKKIIQFSILVFLEAQEINLRGNLQGGKCDWYFIFLWELFPCYQKVLNPLDPGGFFQNISTPTPDDVFNWSSLVNNAQFY